MIKLNVNDVDYELEIKSHEILSDVLRHRLGLRGVRISCGDGECGSCTVLLDGEPVVSCLILAMQVEGKKITTIEGIGTEDDLHPIQEAFIEEQGFQCGYCTPGVILSTKALLDKNPNPNPSEVAEALNGNICRCGAYAHITRAVLNAAEKIAD